MNPAMAAPSVAETAKREEGNELEPYLQGVRPGAGHGRPRAAEIFRAGIVSIRRGQHYAGLALGMSRFEVYRTIVLPQALMRVLPALASTWVSLFKDTSLVSVIAIAELSYVSLQIRTQSFRVLETLTAMAAIYWALGYPQAKLVDWLYRRFKVTE